MQVIFSLITGKEVVSLLSGDSTDESVVVLEEEESRKRKKGWCHIFYLTLQLDHVIL